MQFTAPAPAINRTPLNPSMVPLTSPAGPSSSSSSMAMRGVPMKAQGMTNNASKANDDPFKDLLG